MDSDSQSNIVKYKKKHQIHFIAIVFSLILVYLISQLYRWSSREYIRIFTVQTSQTLESVHQYRGVITRGETVYQTEENGYINYFVREGQKAGVGATVYTTDETGEFSRKLAETFSDGTALSDSTLINLKNILYQTSTQTDSGSFSDAYKEQQELKAAVTDSFLYTATGQLFSNQNLSSLSRVTADQSGYILFHSDSLDGLKAEDVTEASFDEKALKTEIYSGGESRSAGAFAYKLVPDDSFSITFEINEDDYQKYQGRKYLNIELISLGIRVNGSFSTRTTKDGTLLGTITLNKYGNYFLTGRYLDFWITQTDINGYKIPVTAVTSKDFLIIPRDFVTKGGTGQNTYGVYREVSGYSSRESEFVPVSIYAETDEYYYISGSGLSVGDYLIQEKTNTRYLLSTTAPLDGVYNINRGYCIFRQIEILDTTSDGNYYMVSTQTRFGLSAYDRIVLNADLVTENQIIN